MSAATVLSAAGAVSRGAGQGGNSIRVVDNLAATTDPGVSNDNTEGYHAGSQWFNTSAGRMWMCTDATLGAAVWKHMAFGDAPWGPSDPDFSDSTIFLTPFVSNTSAGPLVANRIYMIPVSVPRRRTYSTYVLNLTTLAGTSIIRMGLYSYNASGQPTAKLDEASATVDASTGTGSTGIKTLSFTSNQDLRPGPHFIGVVTDGVPQVTRYNTSNNPISGMRFASATVSANGAKYRDAGASTLPSDESAQSYTTMATGVVQVPLVGIR